MVATGGDATLFEEYFISGDTSPAHTRGRRGLFLMSVTSDYQDFYEKNKYDPRHLHLLRLSVYVGVLVL